jgi:hypothetical protein
MMWSRASNQKLRAVLGLRDGSYGFGAVAVLRRNVRGAGDSKGGAGVDRGLLTG